MGIPLRILIVEDSEDDTLLLVRELRRGGYEPNYRRVDNAGDMAAALQAGEWDVISADHRMPHFNSTAALQLVKERGLDIPFIIISGTIGEESAVAAMKAGAQDYLMKDKLQRLVPAIEREIREASARRQQRQHAVALLAHQEQLRIAREIQQNLFPPGQLRVESFDLAGLSLPAEATGGDYFDYIPMPDQHLGIVIGDVTGHGLGASLLMAEMRACLRTLAMSATDVSEILARANGVTREDFGGNRFLTLLFARLNLETGHLMYLNAGHPSGYILDIAGNIRTELRSSGMPLGIHPLEEFPQAGTAQLEPGDTVVLLTDGVLDSLSCDSDVYGADRALDLVRQHLHRPAAVIVEELCRVSAESPNWQEMHRDDITAVVMKLTGQVRRRLAA